MNICEFTNFPDNIQSNHANLLIHADWLEEQGDWKAEVLRIVIDHWKGNLPTSVFRKRMQELTEEHSEIKELTWFTVLWENR